MNFYNIEKIKEIDQGLETETEEIEIVIEDLDLIQETETEEIKTKETKKEVILLYFITLYIILLEDIIKLV